MLHLCDRSSFRRPLIGVLGRAAIPAWPWHTCGRYCRSLPGPSQHQHYGQGERDRESSAREPGYCKWWWWW
jgi:hypothetical protein